VYVVCVYGLPLQDISSFEDVHTEVPEDTASASTSLQAGEDS